MSIAAFCDMIANMAHGAMVIVQSRVAVAAKFAALFLIITSFAHQHAEAADIDSFSGPTDYSYSFSPAKHFCLDAQNLLDPQSLQPLILIHGWRPEASTAGYLLGDWRAKPQDDIGDYYNYWGEFLTYFCSRFELWSKYRLFHFSYWTHVLSLNDLGSGLSTAIDTVSANDPQYFGNKRISIIAHSMGGLVARNFMNLANGGDRVDRVITLGTPHHGSPIANNPVRDAKHPAWTWYMDFFENGALLGRMPPYNVGNRPSLWWDNYDSMWNSASVFCIATGFISGCPDAQNADLQAMNNDRRYDYKIIAYAGLTSWDVERPHCFPDPVQVSNIYGCGAVILGKIFGMESDGIVPKISAWFDGHLFVQTRGPFAANHSEIIAQAKVFDTIRRDLLSPPPPPPLPISPISVVSISPSSDLVPQNIALLPPLPVPRSVTSSSPALAPGANFTVLWSLANIGNAAANAASLTAVRINQSPTKATGANLKFVNTNALAAGASALQGATLTAPTTPGKYYVWVIADDYGAVTNQSDTTNDLQPSAAFIVSGPVADLVPQTITPSATTVTAGSNFTVSWTLANNGTADANSTSVTVARINQSQTSAAPIANLTGVSTPALAAGASVVQSTTLTAPIAPGTYYVWIIADDFSDVINQTNTDNDLQHSAAITVTPLASCTPIATVNDLQNISQDLAGNYCLTNDIDASATAGWNNGDGFIPIGASGINPFVGTLNGKNYNINSLTIKSNAEFVGLFGYINGAKIFNVGLINAVITGRTEVGAIAGYNLGGTITNAYATGAVTGGELNVGGLIGTNYAGTVAQSYSTASVNGTGEVGGLIGFSTGDSSRGYSTITRSFASGAVTGQYDVGGLVGAVNFGSITQSYATGPLVAQTSSTFNYVGGQVSYTGGLVGYIFGTVVTESFATGAVSGVDQVGGLIGASNAGQITHSYAKGGTTGSSNVGGLVGFSISDAVIAQSYATGAVQGNSLVGGLIGSFAASSNGASVSQSYWDTQTSGASTGIGGTIPGSVTVNLAGLTTSQLKAGLPSGFDNAVWGIESGITYPYLLWLRAAPSTPTTAAVGSSLNPSIFGQSVTFTATVQSSAGGTPTGIVTFYDGTTVLGYAALSGGSASFSLSTLAVGSHSITVSYAGDGAFGASTSASLTQAVNALPASTLVVLPAANISSSGNKGGPFSPAAFSYQLSASSGTVNYTITNIPPWLTASSVSGSVTAAGTLITFMVSANSLAAGTYNSGSIIVTNMTNGQGGASIGASLTVNPATSQTALQTSLNPSVTGQTVTFTANVNSTAGIPTGTVSFKDGSTPLGSVTLSAGTASLQVGSLAAGSHIITADYSGDSNIGASTSSALPQNIFGVANIALSSVPNFGPSGLPVTLSATVGPSAPATGTPTGTVTFDDAGTTLAAGTLSGGSATVVVPGLGAGGHPITATYNGDANFSSGTSATLSQQVISVGGKKSKRRRQF